MTLSDLILHPTTRRNLQNYLRQPTHALLLTGEKGVGLGTIAKTLAREIAGANLVIITPRLHDQQKTLSINVDDIRDLRQLTRDRRSDPLCLVIDEAESMTTSAPEAFLKALEEPTAQVFYILTTHAPAKLPRTIRSRAQIIEILPPPAEACEGLFDGFQNDKILKITFLADRKPAEMMRLLTDEDHFRAAAAAVTAAKDFVQGSPATRLEIVAGTTTRQAAIDLTENIAKILMMTAERAKTPNSTAENLHLVAATLDNLNQNGNLRAQLTNLALNL